MTAASAKAIFAASLTIALSFGAMYAADEVTIRKFGGFILPELEKEGRLFTPWSSAATADFVAMTANVPANLP
jgi:endoglucanase